MNSNLARRVVSAIGIGLVVLPLVWAGGPWLAGGVALLALGGTWEFCRMLRQAGHRPMEPLGLLLALALVAIAYWRPGPDVLGGLLAGALMISLAWQVLQRDSTGGASAEASAEALVGWGLTLAGALYVGWLAAHIVLLRGLAQGLLWVALALAITWASDIAAYSAGRAWGRRKLAPKISPHKTWEGGIAGLLAGTLIALLAVPFLHVPVAHALALGFLATVAGTFGDLGESLIKRQVGVKDSGTLIPGHGGILDRIDSLLFVVVVVYYYAVWVLGVSPLHCVQGRL
jgi:phosphatidate cytidylyltransferase